MALLCGAMLDAVQHDNDFTMQRAKKLILGCSGQWHSDAIGLLITGF
jgi:hypothetical protein